MTDNVKTALILEGGGCKGAFEGGIIKYIREQNIHIDLVGGTSVGGLNAACFAFGKEKELVDLWENIDNGQVYGPSGFVELLSLFEKAGGDNTVGELGEIVQDLFNLFREPWWKKLLVAKGLYDRCKRLMDRYPLTQESLEVIKLIVKNLFEKGSLLDNTPLQNVCERLFDAKMVADAKMTFFITAFELQRGQLMYFGKDVKGGDLNVPVVDALMATSAIQGAFPVKGIGSLQYIDGGNGANLPLEYAIRHNCNRIILARDNMPEQPATQKFSKVWEVVLRAYLASFTNITIKDGKWAGELTKRLEVIARNRERLENFSHTIGDSSVRSKYEEMLGGLEPIFDNKIPIRIFPVFPNPSPDNPENIVDFRSDTSRKLIAAGYERAKEALKDFPG